VLRTSGWEKGRCFACKSIATTRPLSLPPEVLPEGGRAESGWVGEGVGGGWW